MLKRLLNEVSVCARTSLKEIFFSLCVLAVISQRGELASELETVFKKIVFGNAPSGRAESNHYRGHMEPDKRNGGCGVIFNDKLYVWGGQTLDVEQPDVELELEEGDEPLEAVEVVTSLPRPDDVSHPFDVLDLSRMVWSQVTTSARHADKEKYEIPNLGLGSSLLLDPEAECFLLFGGFNELQFDAKVYRIFPGVWEWDVIEPSSDITPTPRYLAGVLIHNNRLCVFGGVSGPITDGVDYGATHVPTRDSNGALLDYGWNNEYFEMDLSTSKLGQQLDIPCLNLWEEKSA